MIRPKLKKIIRDNLSVVLQYNPYERFEGVDTKEGFLELLSNDPAFAPFYLNNSKYATARVGGNLITSLHRKLGDMYEDLFKTLLRETIKVPERDLTYSLELNIDGQMQERSTDGFIRLSTLHNPDRTKIKSLFNLENEIGIAFEVRSCYQIGDSKRIQADSHMAVALKNKKILPCMLIFCTTSLPSPVERLSKTWILYQGNETFEIIKKITGFDLYSYLVSEEKTIKPLMNKIFRMM